MEPVRNQPSFCSTSKITHFQNFIPCEDRRGPVRSGSGPVRSGQVWFRSGTVRQKVKGRIQEETLRSGVNTVWLEGSSGGGVFVKSGHTFVPKRFERRHGEDLDPRRRCSQSKKVEKFLIERGETLDLNRS